MSEYFKIVEEFQQFLNREAQQNFTFVRDEIHYMNANTTNESLNFDVPLYPLFFPHEIGLKYERFGKLIHYALETVLNILSNRNHQYYQKTKEILGVDTQIEEILQQPCKGGRIPRVVRPDTVIVDSQIKAHEFNVSWPGGIPDSDVVIKVLQENTLYNKFVAQMEQQNIHFFSPTPNFSTKMLLEQIVEAAECENPYIVLLLPRPAQLQYFKIELPLMKYVEMVFKEEGYETDLIFPDQLTYENSKVTYQGRKVDVAYRIFEWHYVQNDPGDLGYKKVVAAATNGDLAVVNSFCSEALSAKSIFEVFWDEQLASCFEENLLEELRDSIPKTFNLKRINKEQEEFIKENKENWVIKTVKGDSGSGVVLGKLVDIDTWISILTYGRTQANMVAQEYITAPQMMICTVEENKLVQSNHFIDINPLYFSGKMANFFARYSKTHMTAACMPGLGGVYPIVVTKNYSGC